MPAAPDSRSEPVDWGTSFGRSGESVPDGDVPIPDESTDESPPRKARFGGSKPTGSRGARKTAGSGSGWGRSKRSGASSFASPFGPAVGASAEDQPDSDAAGPPPSTDEAGASFLPPLSPSDSGESVGGGTALQDGLDGPHPQDPTEPPRSHEEWSSEARSVLLRQLAVAPRSRHQLAAKLAEREIPSDVADALLDRFEEVKLIDDAEFALMWVRSRASGKSLARSAMRRELSEKGIDAELAEAALLQVSDDDEHAQARDMVLRRVRSSSDLSDRQVRDKEVRRLVGMLARKGYSPGVGFSIVRDVLAELRAEESEP